MPIRTTPEHTSTQKCIVLDKGTVFIITQSTIVPAASLREGQVVCVEVTLKIGVTREILVLMQADEKFAGVMPNGAPKFARITGYLSKRGGGNLKIVE